MNEILERTFYQNTVQDYLIALGIVVVGILLVRAFKYIIVRRIKKLTEKSETNIDDYIIRSIERFGVPALYFGVLYLGINYLILSARLTRIVDIATTVVITFLIIRFLSATILLLLRSYVRRQENGEEKVKQLGGIMIIINIIIWVIGIVFLLDNMGKDVTAIIAGLGIGGIAIALAAQNILGDLFNYFVIFFDKPFEIGDFIIIDSKMGVVDYIGIKTTRVKSLSGEQLVFSNSDLTTSRIHNYKRMQRRRVVFKIGVIYQTSYEYLQQIPAMLREFVEQQQNVQFDRSHFAAYGDSSLDFEVVYYVLSSDYNTYMDIQQAINLKIFESFQQKGIEFAYPTRTLFVSNQEVEEGEKKTPYES